jgi:uncharacterized membrane protein
MQPNRIPLIDLARTAALMGMVVFHLTYDLLIFGLIDSVVAGSTWFWAHARIVAGSFIALAGLSLWLAHGNGVNWPGFTRRWVKIAAAAALVTVATYLAMPKVYVFFGILHAIALNSLIGIALIRLPPTLLLGLAGFLIWGSYNLATPLFDAPVLRFLGLSTLPAQTVDFEPVFPWLAAFLAGMGFGRIGQAVGLWDRLRGWPDGRATRLLCWPGQHSLAIYLIHQPVLLALVAAYAQLR